MILAVFAISCKAGGMTKNRGDVAMNRYKNLSTAPSYVKIKVRDEGKIINVIWDNTDLFTYFLEKGMGDEEEYVDYMINHEETVFEIDINDYADFVGKKRFGNKKSGRRYVNKFIFEQPLNLGSLGVSNRNKLLNKYFNFSRASNTYILKSGHYEEYNLNPAFIALLIESGFEVFRGDYVPVLSIRQKREGLEE